MATLMDHDDNGPFVRSSHDATPEGQTETVFGIEVRYRNGDIEVWDTHHDQITDERERDIRQMAYRHGGKERPIADIRQVSRRVTISATPWTPIGSVEY